MQRQAKLYILFSQKSSFPFKMRRIFHRAFKLLLDRINGPLPVFQSRYLIHWYCVVGALLLCDYSSVLPWANMSWQEVRFFDDLTNALFKIKDLLLQETAGLCKCSPIKDEPKFPSGSRDCRGYEKPAGKCHGLLRGTGWRVLIGVKTPLETT